MAAEYCEFWGIKEIWYNSGLPAMRIARNATIKRLIDDIKDLNIDKSGNIIAKNVSLKDMIQLIKENENLQKSSITLVFSEEKYIFTK